MGIGKILARMLGIGKSKEAAAATKSSAESGSAERSVKAAEAPKAADAAGRGAASRPAAASSGARASVPIKKPPVKRPSSTSQQAVRTASASGARRVRRVRRVRTAPATGVTPQQAKKPTPVKRQPVAQPRPEPAKPAFAMGAADTGSDEDDFLKNLDTMLKESDRATTGAGEVEYDEGTRIELQQLFEQMLPEYVPPIRECLVKIKGGNQSRIIVESLLGAITPLIFAAEHVEASETYQALKNLKEPLERSKKTNQPLTRDDIKAMIREYNKIVIQLKEARKKLGETSFVRKKTATATAGASGDQDTNLDSQGTEPALLDILGKIEGIGGEEIERLYAAGLTTVATLREATVKDVMDLTGINASLALQIVRAVYEAKPE